MKGEPIMRRCSADNGGQPCGRLLSKNEDACPVHAKPREPKWSGKVADLIRLTQDELDSRVRSGSAEDLSFLDLSDLSLAGAELTGFVIEHSNLNGIDLRKANLRDCAFTGVNLDGADLEEATLQRAYFFQCSLRTVDFSDADISDALFDGVDLRGAKFQDSNLDGCRLLRSNASTADFARAIVTRAYLDETAFVETTLSQSSLVRSSLLGCDLRDADLAAADLERADLRNAQISGAKLHLTSFDRTKMVRGAFQAPFFEEAKRLLVPTAEVYEALRANFESIGRYEDARWAYVQARRFKRKSYSPRYAWTYHGDEVQALAAVRTHTAAGKVLVSAGYHARWTLGWLGAWGADFASGFGEMPTRVVEWGLLVVLGFAAVFAMTGTLAGIHTGEARLGYFLNCLLFSMASFFSFGLTAIHAADIHGDALATIEAGLGTAWFGLLLFTLGNRISKS